MTTASAAEPAGLTHTCVDFWQTYYSSMKRLHTNAGRTLQEPIRDRNLGTTDSKHIFVFEKYWRERLAAAIGVGESEVGPRKIRFRSHRSKNFDVCWPKTGDPKILISIKSMQNAYRNLTNRVEEAIGDSAVLRLYNSTAVFGFFFFMLNGNVPNGKAQQGVSKRTNGPKGVAPYLDLIEEGGDFFDLSDVDRYRKPPKPVKEKLAAAQPKPKKEPAQPKLRQDTVQIAQASLLDLISTGPTKTPTIHYDGIAFAPTRITRLQPDDAEPPKWEATLSAVDDCLSHARFLDRLIDTARLREFIE